MHTGMINQSISHAAVNTGAWCIKTRLPCSTKTESSHPQNYVSQLFFFYSSINTLQVNLWICSVSPTKKQVDIMVPLCAHGDLTVMKMMSFMSVSAWQVSPVGALRRPPSSFLTQDSYTNIMQDQNIKC